MNHVVIMAGGVGSRIWPLSTPEFPKQFVDILGTGRSMIQMTVDRFKGVCPVENFWIVTNVAYVEIVKEQLPEIPVNHILAEPAARNTAPCIAWASWMVRSVDQEANIVVTPSDAVVMDPVEFRRVIGDALEFSATHPSIVTIGVQPSRPETGYGYIETGDAAEGEIFSVRAFKEKPSLEVAQQYLANRRFLWNAGIFVWKADTIIKAVSRYKPSIAETMERITAGGSVEELFPQCEKISIDFAVMEPAASDGLVYTHPAEIGWSDLGTWEGLREHLNEINLK